MDLITMEDYEKLYNGSYQSFLEKNCKKNCKSCNGNKDCRITKWG